MGPRSAESTTFAILKGLDYAAANGVRICRRAPDNRERSDDPSESKNSGDAGDEAEGGLIRTGMGGNRMRTFSVVAFRSELGVRVLCTAGERGGHQHAQKNTQNPFSGQVRKPPSQTFASRLAPVTWSARRLCV